MPVTERLKKIDKLEIVKYCNKNIEILLSMKREVSLILLDLLHNEMIDYETYDKIINVNLHRLIEMLEERYEPALARELWNYASRRMFSINIRLNEFRLAKKNAVNYLGRQQFYRQSNLPVELNLMIEEEIKSEEKDAGFINKVIFYTLEKARLIGSMGKRDVWYYGEDYRLNNDASEEVKKNIWDCILLPCGQGQHNIPYDYTHTAQSFSYHFNNCLHSSTELRYFAEQMLEIIERAAIQCNQDEQQEQTSESIINGQENESQQNQVENQNSNQPNSLSAENNVSESQVHQTTNNETYQGNSSNQISLNNESNNNIFYSSSSAPENSSSNYANNHDSSYENYSSSNNYSFPSSENNSFISSTSKNYTDETKENNPSNYSSNTSPANINNPSDNKNPSLSSNSSASSFSGGGFRGFASSSEEDNSAVMEEPKPNNEPTGQSSAKPEIKSVLKQSNEFSDLTNPEELTKQKQQTIQDIQEKLTQYDLNDSPDFANWKQEIEKSQSLEAVVACQKNLLAKLEEKKQFLSTKQIKIEHNKVSIAPVIIAGIVIFGITFVILTFWFKNIKNNNKRK